MTAVRSHQGKVLTTTTQITPIKHYPAITNYIVLKYKQFL